MAVPFRKILKARDLVLKGLTVNQIAQELNISESTVRLYTKSERERVRQERSKAR